MICLNGLVLRREALHSASNARFLLDSMFDFAERLNALRLTDQEIGLFCAVVVIAPGMCHYRNDLNLIILLHYYSLQLLSQDIHSKNERILANRKFSEVLTSK